MQFISESLISIKLLNDNELKTTIKCNKGYVKSCVNFTVEFKRFCKNSKKIYIYLAPRAHQIQTPIYR